MIWVQGTKRGRFKLKEDASKHKKRKSQGDDIQVMALALIVAPDSSIPYTAFDSMSTIGVIP